MDMMRGVASSHCELNCLDISSLPLFNPDRFMWPNHLNEVESFRRTIHSADALVFSASEYPQGYAYSLTGPLKNALDWASMEPNVLVGKPAAFLGVDSLTEEGMNCYHLRQLAIILGLDCLAEPQFCLVHDEYYNKTTGRIDEDKVDTIKHELGKVLTALVRRHTMISSPRARLLCQESEHFQLVNPEVRKWHVDDGFSFQF